MKTDYGDNILNVSAELFKKNGLHSTTMDDIAHEMRISKKTIYKKYRSKKEILSNIASIFFMNYEKRYENLKGAKNAVKELLLLLQYLTDFFSYLHPRIIFDIKKYYPEIWKMFLKHSDNVILENIKQNLKRGIEEGVFRKEININLVAKLTVEQIQLAFDPTLFPHDQYPLNETLQQLLKMYLFGTTHPGFSIGELRKQTENFTLAIVPNIPHREKKET